MVVRVVIDRIPSHDERMAALAGWFLDGWGEFVSTVQRVPDPVEHMDDAVGLVADRLGPGTWVVPGGELVKLAALLAVDAVGWADIGDLVREVADRIADEAEPVE